MNFTQFNELATTTTELITQLEQQIQTPQRKARYNDKQRIRLKDVKSWALQRSGCADTKEVKKYLKILRKKLDLRLTSAWIAVNNEFADTIKSIKEEVKWSVGDAVEWTGYKPMQAYICQWFPLRILAIENGKALLELWLQPVPLDELVAV